MHPNLKQAIEDYQNTKLPKPPTLLCPHCGEPMKIEVQVEDPRFSTSGELDVKFSAHYYCPTKGSFDTLWYFLTKHPDRGWQQGGGGSCYIATATYGTSLHQDLDILRAFRDSVLLKHNLGKTFVHYYYKTSPPIAEFIRNRSWLKCPIKLAIKSIVSVLQAKYTRFKISSLEKEKG